MRNVIVYEIGDRIKYDSYSFTNIYKGFIVGTVTYIEDMQTIFKGVKSAPYQWCKYLIEYYVQSYKGRYFNIPQKVGTVSDFFNSCSNPPRIITNNELNLPKYLINFDFELHL